MVDFSCNLLILYPVVHFLKMWLNSIIAITKKRWIAHLSGICLSESSALLSFFLLLLITLSRFPWSSRTVWLRMAFYTFWDSVISSFERPYCKPFFSQSRPLLVFLSRVIFNEDVCIYIYIYIYGNSHASLVPLQHPFCPLGKSPRQINE